MRQTFRVRYYECDMQKVVHNAVYLAWCDDLGDRMFRQAGLAPDSEWEPMVKAASITWSTSAGLDDEVTVDVEISRWGTTSFDATYAGRCDGVEVFETTITYVAVDMTDERPIPVPEGFRTALTGA